MLMYMFVETRIRPCYMYIHEDDDLQALATAHSLWTLVRGIMVERLSILKREIGLGLLPVQALLQDGTVCCCCSLYVLPLAP